MNAIIQVTSDILHGDARVTDSEITDCSDWLRAFHRRPGVELVEHALRHGWRLEVYCLENEEWLPVH